MAQLARQRPVPPPFSRSLWRFVMRLATYAVLIAVGLLMAFPFIFMFFSSLKTSAEVITVPPRLLPDPWWNPAQWQWGNYRELLSIPSLPFGRQLLNSIVVTIGIVSGQVLTSLLAGYAFARLRFPGRDTMFVVYLGTLMVPFAVLIVPMYQLMLLFNWDDKLVALILPWVFSAYGTFLMRQFFLTMPRELEEAALIDGANRWQILFRIAVPLAVPAIATLATFSFLYAWNSFLWPLIIITDAKSRVITQGIMDLQALYAARTELVMAGSVLAVLPTMIVYLLAQRYFIEGVATAGLAGR